METIPAPPIRIATLEERCNDSAAIPWEAALAAMQNQTGYKADHSENPVLQALSSLSSMQQPS